MAKKQASAPVNKPTAPSRGLGDIPAMVIAMLTSLLLMAGLVATLNALVFTR